MSGIEIFRSLNEWLRSSGKSGEVAFGEPASTDEIRDVESALKAKLPPSYVEFVTTHGAFFVGGDLTGRGRGNDTRLFLPHELLTETMRYRDELAGANDTDSQAVLDDGLLFCGDPVGEYFHLFVVSSSNEDGEMATRGYDYQDPANSDPWYEGDGTFESVLEEIAQTVRDSAE